MDITTWKKQKLQAHLRELKLPVSGNKPELIARILEVSGQYLTHFKKTDLVILSNLSDEDVLSACAVDKYAENLCDISFWTQRIVNLRKNTGELIHDMYLIHMSRKGYLSLVEYLINTEGADVRAKNYESLISAAENGHLDVVKYLIEQAGGNVHARKDESLILASKNGHLDIVKYLIEKEDGNIHAKNDKSLILASKHGHFSIVKYLIARGAKVNARKHKAFIEAVKSGHSVILQYLLEKGVTPDAQDISLKEAATDGYLDIVKILIETGEADVHSYDDYALRIAMANKHIKLVKYLLETAGANVNAQNGETLIWASAAGDLGLVKYLLEKAGANVHAGKYRQDGVLVVAALSGNLELVKYLIKRGLDINVFDNFDLENIVKTRNISIIKLLLEIGVKVDQDLIEHIQKLRINKGYKKQVMNLLEEYKKTN